MKFLLHFWPVVIYLAVAVFLWGDPPDPEIDYKNSIGPITRTLEQEAALNVLIVLGGWIIMVACLENYFRKCPQLLDD